MSQNPRRGCGALLAHCGCLTLFVASGGGACVSSFGFEDYCTQSTSEKPQGASLSQPSHPIQHGQRIRGFGTGSYGHVTRGGRRPDQRVPDIAMNDRKEADAEVRALVEHALSDRSGEWQVPIVGSRENDCWEMKIWGRMGLSDHKSLVGRAHIDEG